MHAPWFLEPRGMQGAGKPPRKGTRDGLGPARPCLTVGRPRGGPRKPSVAPGLALGSADLRREGSEGPGMAPAGVMEA